MRLQVIFIIVGITAILIAACGIKAPPRPPLEESQPMVTSPLPVEQLPSQHASDAGCCRAHL